MMVFNEKTRLAAWLAATEHLIEAGSGLNVVLSIAAPGSDGVSSKEARAAVDRFLAAEGQAPLHTVAETIFPAWEYRKRGLAGVFDTYPAEYDLFKRGDGGRWGTYAYRLVRRRNAAGTMINPLQELLSKMRNEVQQTNRGSYRSCYELGVAEGEYDLPLYNTVDDEGRRRGGPCLSHLSFKLYDGRVHLTAIYRSHDYRYKTLGNLLGLARLQACVSEQVGLPLGTLVVHSTYAFVEKSKTRLRELISEIRALRA
jgi:thymidylate synthase